MGNEGLRARVIALVDRYRNKESGVTPEMVAVYNPLYSKLEAAVDEYLGKNSQQGIYEVKVLLLSGGRRLGRRKFAHPTEDKGFYYTYFYDWANNTERVGVEVGTQNATVYRAPIYPEDNTSFLYSHALPLNEVESAIAVVPTRPDFTHLVKSAPNA